MKQHGNVIVTIAFAALCAACGPLASGPSSNIPAELAGRWDVQQIAGASLGQGVDMYIEIDAEEGAITGFTGCNAFSASLTAFSETIAIGAVNEAEGDCASEAHATDEARLLGVLPHIQRYNRNGRSLEMLQMTPGGEALLLLRYADEQP